MPVWHVSREMGLGRLALKSASSPHLLLFGECSYLIGTLCGVHLGCRLIGKSIAESDSLDSPLRLLSLTSHLAIYFCQLRMQAWSPLPVAHKTICFSLDVPEVSSYIFG